MSATETAIDIHMNNMIASLGGFVDGIAIAADSWTQYQELLAGGNVPAGTFEANRDLILELGIGGGVTSRNNTGSGGGSSKKTPEEEANKAAIREKEAEIDRLKNNLGDAETVAEAQGIGALLQEAMQELIDLTPYAEGENEVALAMENIGDDVAGAIEDLEESVTKGLAQLDEDFISQTDDEIALAKFYLKNSETIADANIHGAKLLELIEDRNAVTNDSEAAEELLMAKGNELLDDVLAAITEDIVDSLNLDEAGTTGGQNPFDYVDPETGTVTHYGAFQDLLMRIDEGFTIDPVALGEGLNSTFGYISETAFDQTERHYRSTIVKLNSVIAHLQGVISAVSAIDGEDLVASGIRTAEESGRL